MNRFAIFGVTLLLLGTMHRMPAVSARTVEAPLIPLGTTVAIDDPITGSSVSVTVEGIDEFAGYDPIGNEPAQHHYVSIVTLDIEHAGPGDVTVEPGSFRFLNGSGRVLRPISLFRFMPGGEPSGQPIGFGTVIPPGDRVPAWILLETPLDTAPARGSFSFDFRATHDVPILDLRTPADLPRLGQSSAWLDPSGNAYAELTVNDLTIPWEGDRDAASGAERALLEITIENVGSRGIPIGSSAFRAVDSDGIAVPPAFTADLGPLTALGFDPVIIPPGDRLNGGIVFEGGDIAEITFESNTLGVPLFDARAQGAVDDAP